MPQTTNEEYASQIFNRRVALVGPAPSLQYTNGEYLNTFDTIAYVNSTFKLGAASYADRRVPRADVVYHACDNHISLSIDQMRERGVSMICASQSHTCGEVAKNMRETLRKQDKIPYRLRDDRVNGLLSKHGVQFPTTGLYAILDILSFKPKRLHVCGITFYQANASVEDEYSDGYVAAILPQSKSCQQHALHKYHNVNNQFSAYWKHVYKPNTDIITHDPTLQEIVDNAINSNNPN